MRCNQMLNKHNDKGIVVYIHHKNNKIKRDFQTINLDNVLIKFLTN